MEKTNFNAMMTTASDKYTRLIDDAYKLKNGSDLDFDKFINLIHSVYMDEAELIFRLCCEGAKEEKIKEIQTPSFISCKNGKFR